MKAFDRNWEYLQAHKRDVPCTDCGEVKAARKMVYHHVRGPKLFNVGQVGDRSLETLKAEIAKCELVCQSCHMKRHWALMRVT